MNASHSSPSVTSGSSLTGLERLFGLGTPPEDPEDPPVDPHVDVRRLEYLAVAVPHARPRDLLLAVPGQRGEAVVKRVQWLVIN